MTPTLQGSLTRFQKKAAFTLTEIVLCVAIISTVLVAVMGILPVGLDVSRKAMDHTVVATILEDVYNRLQGEVLTEAEASFSPAYFDDLGVYLLAPKDGTSIEDTERYFNRRTYRAQVNIVRWSTPPANTSQLHAVRVRLFWPLDGNGNPVGDPKPKAEVTFPVTTLAGSDWGNIDPQYRPKIEH
ncbi:MAG: hypothetical protein ACAI34_14535 [Verrucomicrobium sp.]|nr:hypothetical protein [Verrucomicrobium sp.]